MAGVSAFLNANTMVAMVRRGLGTVISSKPVSRKAVSLLHVSFFAIYHVHLPCIWKMDVSELH